MTSAPFGAARFRICGVASGSSTCAESAAGEDAYIGVEPMMAIEEEDEDAVEGCCRSS